MYIHIELESDVDLKEATRIAQQIHDVLDASDNYPSQMTEISVGGERITWMCDAKCDAQEITA